MPDASGEVSTAWPPSDLEDVRSCPACGSSQRSLLHDCLRDQVFGCAPGVWALWRCGACSAAYLDPRPSASSIGRAYATYYTHADADAAGELGPGGVRSRVRLFLVNSYLCARYRYRAKPSFRPAAAAMRARPELQGTIDWSYRALVMPRRGARLLDVGCGNGAFLARMRDLGWAVDGLDPDPAAVASARAAGVDVQLASLESADLPQGTYDALSLNHVIEHVHEPMLALQRCARLLKPGGRMWVATPNLDSPGHRIYGPDWRGLEPPRHLVLFTRGALEQACQQAGLGVERVVGVPRQPYYFSASEAIAAGVAPGDAPPMSADRWREARRLDRQAVRHPGTGDDLAMIVRRPG